MSLCLVLHTFPDCIPPTPCYTLSAQNTAAAAYAQFISTAVLPCSTIIQPLPMIITNAHEPDFLCRPSYARHPRFSFMPCASYLQGQPAPLLLHFPTPGTACALPIQAHKCVIRWNRQMHVNILPANRSTLLAGRPSPWRSVDAAAIAGAAWRTCTTRRRWRRPRRGQQVMLLEAGLDVACRADVHATGQLAAQQGRVLLPLRIRHAGRGVAGHAPGSAGAQPSRPTAPHLPGTRRQGLR